MSVRHRYMSVRHRYTFALLTALAVSSVLGACGGLRSRVPPDQTYVLRAIEPAPAAEALAPGSRPAETASLRVARPLALPGLESDRIMAVRPDHRLDAYAGSRWPGPLPEVVSALAVDTLRASPRFASVEDERTATDARYLLQLTLRHFEAQYSSAAAPPSVRVTLDGVLVRRSDRAVLGSFTADATADAAANRVTAVVDAFETAARAALAQVLDSTAALAAAATAASNQNGATPVPSSSR
jgi:cholesterol transport system auxiliary component